MQEHPGFRDIGKQMLKTWSEGIRDLRDNRVYAMGDWVPGTAFEGFSDPRKLKAKKESQNAVSLDPIMQTSVPRESLLLPLLLLFGKFAFEELFYRVAAHAGVE